MKSRRVLPEVVGPEEVKSCCATAYASDAVTMLLGDAYHPGGRDLTRRLARSLGVGSGSRVADVACGPGATAVLLATEFGAEVAGVDLGAEVLTRAEDAAQRAGVAGRVRFHRGDAERLPLPDASVDLVVCECALCTFPGKAAAATEFARVLRPGGRVGITDVTAAGDLPPGLGTLAAWIACLADARSLTGYHDILTGAGLRVIQAEPHDRAVERMIVQIDARLRVLRLTAAEQLREAGIDVDAALGYCRLAAGAAAAGRIGYAMIIAEKP